MICERRTRRREGDGRGDRQGRKRERLLAYPRFHWPTPFLFVVSVARVDDRRLTTETRFDETNASSLRRSDSENKGPSRFRKGPLR